MSASGEPDPQFANVSPERAPLRAAMQRFAVAHQARMGVRRRARQTHAAQAAMLVARSSSLGLERDEQRALRLAESARRCSRARGVSRRCRRARQLYRMTRSVGSSIAATVGMRCPSGDHTAWSPTKEVPTTLPPVARVADGATGHTLTGFAHLLSVETSTTQNWRDPHG